VIARPAKDGLLVSWQAGKDLPSEHQGKPPTLVTRYGRLVRDPRDVHDLAECLWVRPVGAEPQGPPAMLLQRSALYPVAPLERLALNL